jgi:hypothetical protein
MPLNTFLSSNSTAFEKVLSLIESGKFKEQSALTHFLIKALFNFSVREKHIQKLLDWFPLQRVHGCELTLMLKH